jgi:hypothetical protein
LGFPTDFDTKHQYDFSGFHLVAYQRIRSVYYSYVNRFWDDEWSKSNISYLQYQDQADRFMALESDAFTGKWWDRSWSESLVVEKGGAPKERPLLSYGSEMTVFDLGELGSVTNEGKVRLINLSLYFDRRERIDPKTNETFSEWGLHIGDPPGLVKKTWEHQSGNLYNDRYLSVNLNTHARFRLPHAWNDTRIFEAIANAGMDLDIGLYLDKPNQPFLYLNLNAEGSPGDRAWQATFNAQIFIW